MSKIESSMTKFEVKKFIGKENFNEWQKRVKTLLVQQGIHKILQGKSAKHVGTSDEDWEKTDLKAKNRIQLCLTDEIKYNVMNEETVTRLWSKLEMLYMMKSLSNKLYLKK